MVTKAQPYEIAIAIAIAINEHKGKWAMGEVAAQVEWRQCDVGRRPYQHLFGVLGWWGVNHKRGRRKKEDQQYYYIIYPDHKREMHQSTSHLQKKSTSEDTKHHKLFPA